MELALYLNVTQLLDQNQEIFTIMYINLLLNAGQRLFWREYVIFGAFLIVMSLNPMLFMCLLKEIASEIMWVRFK